MALEDVIRKSAQIGNAIDQLKYEIKTADSDMQKERKQKELEDLMQKLEDEKRKQAKAGESGYNDLGNVNHQAPRGNSNPYPQSRSQP